MYHVGVVSLIVVCAYVVCKALVRTYKSTFHVSDHSTPLMEEVCCEYIRTCWVSAFSVRIREEFLPRFFRAWGYTRSSAPENRGICRKNVSYLCQVPYIRVRTQENTTIIYRS